MNKKIIVGCLFCLFLLALPSGCYAQAQRTSPTFEELEPDFVRLLPELRDKIGIMVFTRPNCHYCKEQSAIFSNLNNHFKLENYIEFNTQEYPQLAQEYQVNTVPDIYVVGNINGEVVRKRLRTGLTNELELMELLMKSYYNWFGQPKEQQ